MGENRLKKRSGKNNSLFQKSILIVNVDFLRCEVASKCSKIRLGGQQTRTTRRRNLKMTTWRQTLQSIADGEKYRLGSKKSPGATKIGCTAFSRFEMYFFPICGNSHRWKVSRWALSSKPISQPTCFLVY